MYLLYTISCIVVTLVGN